MKSFLKKSKSAATHPSGEHETAALCDEIQMSSLTVSGLHLLFGCQRMRNCHYPKQFNGLRAPKRALQTGEDLSLPRFHQDTFWLIRVASILLWGHFWPRQTAWCQWVKDHENTFNFKITEAEITIKRILQGFKYLRICCLKKYWENIVSYFSLKKHVSPGIERLI